MSPLELFQKGKNEKHGNVIPPAIVGQLITSDIDRRTGRHVTYTQEKEEEEREKIKRDDDIILFK